MDQGARPHMEYKNDKFIARDVAKSLEGVHSYELYIAVVLAN